jgi:hypothetical protein
MKIGLESLGIYPQSGKPVKQAPIFIHLGGRRVAAAWRFTTAAKELLTRFLPVPLQNDGDPRETVLHYGQGTISIAGISSPGTAVTSPEILGYWMWVCSGGR